MRVSLSGSDLTFAMVRRLAVGVIVVFVVLGYMYGPAASPAMRTKAVDECNAHAGGDYRSYRLSWNVDWHPHWVCWDANRPRTPAVSLGWWTNPFS